MTAVGTIISAHADLRAALRAVLIGTAGLPAAWAWEGEAFEVVTGTPFVREAMRPVTSQVRAIGGAALVEHKLVGAITPYFPAGRGTKDVEAAAGIILQALRPGVNLAYGPITGLVTAAERRALVQEPNWLSCPVLVTVTAYTSN